ncbi:MAG: hypothetical protein DMF06_10475 [Verrucomicrobia bacterium]|nr:MAG: hypothetical protein DMF06_10475 [Verrucomicrobiota bacterium]
MIRARSVDRDVLVDRELVTGEHDALPNKRRVELNGITVAGQDDCVAERSWATVGRIGYDDSGGVKAWNAGHHHAQ